MKKALLLSALLFQITFVFAQKISGESADFVFYETTWGPWVPAPGSPYITFSSKLKFYDKKKNAYVWDIRWNVTRAPIAFEYKLANEVNVSQPVRDNDGYYTTAYRKEQQNKGNSSSGFGVNISSKTVVLFSIRNVCFDFDESGNPKCNAAKTGQFANASQTNKNATPGGISTEYPGATGLQGMVTNAGTNAVNNNQTQAVNNNIAAVSSVAMQLAGTIDAAIAAGKERKKAEAALRASVNDIENAQLWKAFTNDLIMQFEKNGYPFKEITQSVEQNAAQKAQEAKEKNETLNIRMRQLIFKDFEMLIFWHYNVSYGNSKEILITGLANQETLDDIKAKKILNKYIKPKKITFSKADYGKFIIRADDLQFNNSDITDENLNYADSPVTDAELFEQGQNLYYKQKNIPEALTILKKAADRNNAKAMDLLGAIYAGNTSVNDQVKRDENQARLWYEKASNLGYPPAMMRLGYYYEQGMGGLTKDYEKATKWMELAIEKGETIESADLAIMFRDGGYNLKQDYAKALKYYALIPVPPVPVPWTASVKYNMGKIYLTGGYGVEKNLVKAKALFQEACELSTGKKGLADINKSACDAYNSL